MNAWILPDECIACGAESSYERKLVTTEKCSSGKTHTIQHHSWVCKECGVGILGDKEIDEIFRILLNMEDDIQAILPPSH